MFFSHCIHSGPESVGSASPASISIAYHNQSYFLAKLSLEKESVATGGIGFESLLSMYDGKLGMGSLGCGGWCVFAQNSFGNGIKLAAMGYLDWIVDPVLYRPAISTLIGSKNFFYVLNLYFKGSQMTSYHKNADNGDVLYAPPGYDMRIQCKGQNWPLALQMSWMKYRGPRLSSLPVVEGKLTGGFNFGIRYNVFKSLMLDLKYHVASKGMTSPFTLILCYTIRLRSTESFDRTDPFWSNMSIDRSGFLATALIPKEKKESVEKYSEHTLGNEKANLAAQATFEKIFASKKPLPLKRGFISKKTFLLKKEHFSENGSVPDEPAPVLINSPDQSSVSLRDKNLKALQDWICIRGNYASDVGDFFPILLVKSSNWPRKLGIRIHQANSGNQTQEIVADREQPANRWINITLGNEHYDAGGGIDPIKLVPMDGDCFFHAVSHGLSDQDWILLRGSQKPLCEDEKIYTLRKAVAMALNRELVERYALTLPTN